MPPIHNWTPTKPRHKSGPSGPSGKSHKKSLIEQGIIALDGEGENDNDDYQRYNLLCASTGDYIADHDLSDNPSALFEFILSLPSGLPVMYAFDYDVTMWLRKLPRYTLEHLWGNKEHVKQHRCDNSWGYYKANGVEYQLHYIPSHTFTVTRGKGTARISRSVYDQFKFYQQSFVASLYEWNVGSETERLQIWKMKNERERFADINDAEIRKYCFSECRLLVELTRALETACRDGNIVPRTWTGAGSLAKAMLRSHHVKTYNSPTPLSLREPVLSAYFGGRTEISYSGQIGACYGYDIHSAYPNQIRHLPCLAHSQWVYRPGYHPDARALWHVRWDLRKLDVLWPPFPFRLKTGQIIYPLSGEGWYWHSEVETAIRMFPNQITILGGYLLHCQCDHHPFAWVEDAAQRRVKLKHVDNPAHRPIKLGLNAIYGACAQSVGFQDSPPPYTNYIWAGLITAGTRSSLYNTIMHDPNSVVSAATDGIVSIRPLDIPLGDKLGEWEEYDIQDLWLYQPGVASYTTSEHPYVDATGTCLSCQRSSRDRHLASKTRGFHPKEISLHAMQQTYTDHPLSTYTYPVHRFIGLGAALQHRDYRAWLGRWKTDERLIHYCPAWRMPDPPPNQLRGGEQRLRLAPPSAPTSSPHGQHMSAPYIPHQTWSDMWSDDSEIVAALVDAAQP